jgi:hypothetical protein
MIRTLRKRIAGLKQYAPIAAAIDDYLSIRPKRKAA